MVWRRIPRQFCHRAARRSGGIQYIINEKNKTFNDKVYPQLPYMIRERQSNIKVSSQLGNNLSGQLVGLARKITKLFREERIICSSFNSATTLRPHVDRLIVEAMRNGDKHRPTMELANFWLLDKDLIHKLFKELVPRYENYSSAFTAIHRLGIDYDVFALTMTQLKKEGGMRRLNITGQAILELRGNSLPPITRPHLNKPELLTNVLIGAARANHSTNKQQAQSSSPAAELDNRP